ncbi:MAG: class I lanthipeptide [Dinghuibacter sp.]|nr:class I lanthipeptide [Dinghuibacter sp.]
MKQTKKLRFKKSIVVLLNQRHQEQVHGGKQAATQPFYTCRVECFPETWLCPPPQTDP